MKQKNKNKNCDDGQCRSIGVVFFCKKNMVRDIIVIILVVIFISLFFGFYFNLINKMGEKKFPLSSVFDTQLSEQELIERDQENISNAQLNIDTSSWKPYQNVWYGFSVKYPDDWLDPVVKKPSAGEQWEQKIEYTMSLNGENNPFEGFNIKIYNVQKVKELANTDEYPKLMDAELASNSECENIDGHLLETGDYAAEEVYVPIKDTCFNSALFFTNTRDNYIYNIYPRLKEGAGLAGDPSEEIANHLPEFYSIVAEWTLIDIKRPVATQPKKAKASGPKPAAYAMVGGRMVCDKKNDKPGKSKKGKGRHLDMECCLDPDEYPNPWCYYDPGKYGKYL